MTSSTISPPPSVLGSTWIASCVASTAGAIYTLSVCAPIDALHHLLLVILVLSVIGSLAVLTIGSILFGAPLTKFLLRHIHRGRLLVFPMIGAAAGILCSVLYCLATGLNPFDAATVAEAFRYLQLLLIPAVHLAIAGFVTAVQLNRA